LDLYWYVQRRRSEALPGRPGRRRGLAGQRTAGQDRAAVRRASGLQRANGERTAGERRASDLDGGRRVLIASHAKQHEERLQHGMYI